MSSPEEKVNKILSGKIPIDTRNTKIARKVYPGFDSFDANRKLEILLEVNKSYDQLVSSITKGALELLGLN